MSTRTKRQPLDCPVIRELIARRARPGFRDLAGIIRLVARLERAVSDFREAHPPGHRCQVCDHIRKADRLNGPCGPSDAIVALHVSAWEFKSLLDDLNLGPVSPDGYPLDPCEDGEVSP